jgi:predicted nucleic acid-binding Zn ribbon protein
MSLSPCIECGHEISSEAKTCPNCGARNRSYKSKAWKSWLLAALILVVGLIAYINQQMSNYELNMTECDTSDKREAFKSVIENSSFAQLQKLRVIDITKIKRIKSGGAITDLVCEATINFNSIDDKRYRFTWSESESGALLIQAKPK